VSREITLKWGCFVWCDDKLVLLPGGPLKPFTVTEEQWDQLRNAKVRLDPGDGRRHVEKAEITLEPRFYGGRRIGPGLVRFDFNFGEAIAPWFLTTDEWQELQRQF
jgi:hypothetical protein